MTDAGPELPRSPYLRHLPPYPFAELDAIREGVEARGISVIDLALGDPREITPPFLREALAAALTERSEYPRAVGIPVLRRAVAGWLASRFGVTVDPDREVLPANGSKEAIFHFPLGVLDPAGRSIALVPEPGYPVYELGVRAAGGTVHPLPLAADRGFLPDLEAIPEPVWKQAAILWLNYPNNPTGVTAPESFLREAVDRCRRYGVILASDEAYSEIYYGDPPPTALRWGTENVLVFQSLSKRSGLPGFRTGFMAGDPRLIEGLKRIRPGIGVATPQFIQEVSARAWSDEAHVAEIRGRLRANRDRAVEGLAKAGLPARSPAATFFLWLPVPPGHTAESFAARALEAGVALLPGTALGPSGEGFVRLSFAAEASILEEALARLASASL